MGCVVGGWVRWGRWVAVGGDHFSGCDGTERALVKRITHREAKMQCATDKAKDLAMSCRLYKS